MAVKCAQTPGKRFVARQEIVCPFACIRGSIRVSQSRWSWFAGLPSSKATRSFFLPLLTLVMEGALEEAGREPNLALNKHEAAL
jgi:hypothetical protein